MMVEMWVIYVFASAIVLVLAFIVWEILKCNDIERKLFMLKEYKKDSYDVCCYLEKKCVNLEAENEKLKGDIEILRTNLSNYISTSNKRIDKLEESSFFYKAYDSLINTVDNLHEEGSRNGSGSENRAVSGANRGCSDGDVDGDSELIDKYYNSTLKPIIESIKKDAEDKGLVPPKKVSYTWQIADQEHEDLIIGERYLVVGKWNIIGKERIISHEAIWNGKDFAPENSDNRFGYIYAWCKIPQSSDIMEQVVDLYLKKR